MAAGAEDDRGLLPAVGAPAERGQIVRGDLQRVEEIVQVLDFRDRPEAPHCHPNCLAHDRRLTNAGISDPLRPVLLLQLGPFLVHASEQADVLADGHERRHPGEGGIEALKKRDELYESAIDVVVREGRGSVSLLQRALGIGYGRAARLVDFMAEDGIVGQYAGSQAREVLITIDDWERMQSGQKPLSGMTAAAVPHGISASPPLLPASAGASADAAYANGSKASGPHASGNKSSGPKAGETMPRRPNKIIPERDPLPEPTPERGGTARSIAKKTAVADAASEHDEMIHASALPHPVELDQADADESDAPFQESLEDDFVEDSDEDSVEHLEEEVDESDVGDDIEAEFDEDAESDDDYRAESA